MPVDCKELEMFRDNLGKMLNDNDKFIEEITKELAQRLLAMLIKATPADTGFLKKNWSVVLTKTSDGYEAEIINNTNYASYVNYGHRQTPGRYVPAIGKKLKKGWVDGKFFVELSVAELRGITQPLLEKRLEEHLKEAFK
ncbi:MAG: HK97 gp10 family phage protein [Clostridia bacterium]|nr:HK97 gp10 family phage protein [Clostridia bacterium]